MEPKDILTDDESDALRDSAAIADGSPDADAGGIRVIDPDHWDRVLKDRAPALESIAERMVSRFKMTGRRFLRESVEVSTEPAHVVRWGRYLRTFQAPVSLHEIKIDPLGTSGVMCMSSDFIFALVDKFFGGDGSAERPLELAEFTSMENRLARKFVEALIEDIRDSWKPLIELKFDIGKSESNPLFLSIAADSDALSVAPFFFDYADKRISLDIALPSQLIEPMQFAGKNAAQGSGAAGGWRRQIREDVEGANVTLRALLAETELSLRELTLAKPGDVIPIEAPEKIRLLAGDRPIFEGSYGVVRDHHAVQITRRLSTDKSGESYG